jgi:hypothetical protein
MKKRYFKIRIELYKVVVHFSFGQNDEEFSKDLKKELSSIVSEEEMKNLCIMNHSGKTMMHTSGHIVCRLSSLPTTPYYKGVLTHELFHITDFTLERVGVKLSRNSNEAYAYLIEYLTKSVYRKL